LLGIATFVKILSRLSRFPSGSCVTEVAIDANGKIIVVGYAENFGPIDTAVVMYNSDGSIDTDFGNNGKAIFDYAASNDWANGVSLQADGKIVVAGIAYDPDQSFAVARLDGSPGSPGCLFCDDFEDGVIDTNWTYSVHLPPPLFKARNSRLNYPFS
jgi:uncharacterized delta-60 repeat protein